MSEKGEQSRISQDPIASQLDSSGSQISSTLEMHDSRYILSLEKIAKQGLPEGPDQDEIMEKVNLLYKEMLGYPLKDRRFYFPHDLVQVKKKKYYTKQVDEQTRISPKFENTLEFDQMNLLMELSGAQPWQILPPAGQFSSARTIVNSDNRLNLCEQQPVNFSYKDIYEYGDVKLKHYQQISPNKIIFVSNGGENFDTIQHLELIDEEFRKVNSFKTDDLHDEYYVADENTLIAQNGEKLLKLDLSGSVMGIMEADDLIKAFQWLGDDKFLYSTHDGTLCRKGLNEERREYIREDAYPMVYLQQVKDGRIFAADKKGSVSVIDEGGGKIVVLNNENNNRKFRKMTVSADGFIYLIQQGQRILAFDGEEV